VPKKSQKEKPPRRVDNTNGESVVLAKIRDAEG
jgi:hypothetical protein